MPDSNEVIVGLTEEEQRQIAELVRRLKAARGPVMRLVQGVGRGVENKLKQAPPEWRDAIRSATAIALEAAFKAAAASHRSSWVPALPDWGHRAVATATGALANLVPIYGAVAEVPLATSMIFAAILREAKAQGFDPSDDTVRAEALRLFGDASPLPEDDGTDMGFLAARITLATGALDSILVAAATRVAAVLGPKVMINVVPVVGAAAGGSINYAFITYYQEVAAIRFAQLKLMRDCGEEPIRLAWDREVAQSALPEL